MNYPDLSRVSDTTFKRLLGVSRTTFATMLVMLEQRRSPRGRPPKLSAEAQLVLTLSYWRDYPPLFKLGLAYGISEASAWRVVRRVEDQLLHSGLLSLPTVPPSATSQEPVATLIDTTHVVIERPKKTAALV